MEGKRLARLVKIELHSNTPLEIKRKTIDIRQGILRRIYMYLVTKAMT